MRSYLPVAVLVVLALALLFDQSFPRRDPAHDRIGPPVTPSYTFAEMRAIARRAEELEEVRLRTLRFGDAFVAIRADLWERRAGAFAAADRVLEAARELSPTYARIAGKDYPQLSEREATVVSILKNFPADLSCGRVPREAAIAVWEETLCEMFASGEASPALMQQLLTLPGPAQP